MLLTAVAISGGLTSLGLGILCLTRPDPGVDCAVLVVVVPMLSLPIGAGLGIFGAAAAGWLVRETEESMADTGPLVLSPSEGERAIPLSSVRGSTGSPRTDEGGEVTRGR